MGPGLIVAIIAAAIAAVALAKVRSLAVQLGEAIIQRAKDVPEEAGGNAKQLAALQATIEQLQQRAQEHDLLLCSLVTEDEARHLWNISRENPVSYDSHPGVQAELRSLVRRGLVSKRGDFKIHQLPSSFDLRERFQLTPPGKTLLKLRKHLEEKDTRAAHSVPPGPQAETSGASGIRLAELPPAEAPAPIKHSG